MKTKLTHSQLISLVNVFRTIVQDDAPVPEKFEAKLLLALLEGIQKKLERRAIDKKKKYNITFNAVEALSFWLFFSKYHYFDEGQAYEAHLIQMISNSIHQKFTT